MALWSSPRTYKPKSVYLLSLAAQLENKAYGGDEIRKEKMPFKLTCPTIRRRLAFPISCKLAYL
jgi:hypothetical protein